MILLQEKLIKSDTSYYAGKDILTLEFAGMSSFFQLVSARSFVICLFIEKVYVATYSITVEVKVV